MPNVNICHYKHKEKTQMNQDLQWKLMPFCAAGDKAFLCPSDRVFFSPSQREILSPLTQQLYLCCSLASFYSWKFKWMHKVSILNFLVYSEKSLESGLVWCQRQPAFPATYALSRWFTPPCNETNFIEEEVFNIASLQFWIVM